MNIRAALVCAGVFAGVLMVPTRDALAYPPGVGTTSPSRDCVACHSSTGPWDEARTIVDILDSATRKSLRQADGTFLIEVPRGERRTVLTVLGRPGDDQAPAPVRIGWAYVSPGQIATAALTKFAPGWEVTLPMSCRLVGDSVPEYPGARLTALPMTIRPSDAALDADLELQALLTSGNAVKGKASEGLVQSYVVRAVRLDVLDPAPGATTPPVPPKAAVPTAPVTPSPAPATPPRGGSGCAAVSAASRPGGPWRTAAAFVVLVSLVQLRRRMRQAPPRV